MRGERNVKELTTENATSQIDCLHKGFMLVFPSSGYMYGVIAKIKRGEPAMRDAPELAMISYPPKIASISVF
jgi:hypothetical protein